MQLCWPKGHIEGMDELESSLNFSQEDRMGRCWDKNKEPL